MTLCLPQILWENNALCEIFQLNKFDRIFLFLYFSFFPSRYYLGELHGIQRLLVLGFDCLLIVPHIFMLYKSISYKWRPTKTNAIEKNTDFFKEHETALNSWQGPGRGSCLCPVDVLNGRTLS